MALTRDEVDDILTSLGLTDEQKKGYETVGRRGLYADQAILPKRMA